ncbi:GntR family transcriptional regulator / MocR family aminotransferase [Kaistia soli DSM 19436]|uniref:GntR family transcriptional regulator / MocR family aminotransferase n=1 Tax=Kaistia soli DSM 19436 TaxID=1122133 RepID=A0A1M5DYC1_9HYPH|nr:PLP-dependent aminotransferase family protein [Kaistia soli]SHF72028.1 GntR family transcriptional regulator / MocR family aminotransferase [Kaistia soli DSM 19436]
MELALTLDTSSKKSLQAQVFDQVRALILDGRLQADMALPPTRALAERFNVSRNTVMIAYERLAAEGYVEARGTAGIFVTSIPPDDLLLINGGFDGFRSSEPVAQQSSEPILCFAGSPGGETDRPALDFWPGRSAAGAFPLQTWRRIITNLLSTEPQNLTDYCDPAGLPELRKAIADHLGRSRGMHVAMDQIIITAGSQDALNLILNLLRQHTQRLCIENPCYIGASMLFQSQGLPIDPVPVDKDGIRTDCLPSVHRSLLYVTPSRQFPTGVMMSRGRRLALLRWAEETESYIVEDDYDSDLRYDGPPLTSLAGLDQGRRVFHVGTFSKSVGAGLRLGFAVVPRIHWDDARVLKAQMSNGQSWLEQRALAEFITEGHFDRHVRKVRRIYKSRRDCLRAALQKNFGDPVLSGSESGLHLIWQLPPGMPSARFIQAKARELGIGVYALSSGGAFDFGGAEPDDKLMFGYSSLTEKEIVQAVETLRDLLRARH